MSVTNEMGLLATLLEGLFSYLIKKYARVVNIPLSFP